MKCDGKPAVAMILIGVGVLFLFGQIFSFNFWGLIWPMFVIVPGIPFLMAAVKGDDPDMAWLAIPGSIITGTGVLLLYQNTTGHWDSWAYAWTLYGVLIGSALQYAGKRNNEATVQQVGRGITIFAGISFFLLGLFFEMFIFGGVTRRILVAVVIIAVGVFLIALDRNEEKPKPKRTGWLDNGEEYFVYSDDGKIA